MIALFSLPHLFAMAAAVDRACAFKFVVQSDYIEDFRQLLTARTACCDWQQAVKDVVPYLRIVVVQDVEAHSFGEADLDSDSDVDGIVGIHDLLDLLSRWGACH